MLKRLFSYFLLACVVAWLVISYIPALQTQLPTVAFPETWQGALGWLGALSVLAFLAIQVWLVFSTWRSLQQPSLEQRPVPAAPHAAQPAPVPDSLPSRELRPNLAGEVFWTALPILMTVAVAIAGYAIWAGQ